MSKHEYMPGLLKEDETVCFQVIFMKYNISSGIAPHCNWLNDGQLQRISPCINIERG